MKSPANMYKFMDTPTRQAEPPRLKPKVSVTPSKG